MNRVRALLVLIGLLLSLTGCAQPRQQTASPSLAELGSGFESSTVEVNDTTLHYVRGGRGPAVVLVHGFPQDWYEYHRIMPRLAKSFTVVAVDLRGMGGSSVATSGFDAPNLAEDIRQLTEKLGLDRPYVVGHDIGGMVAYAFARLNPATTRGAMILDVPLPGIDPWDESTAGLWHIRFHQTPNLPEELIDNSLSTYFRFNFDPEHFSDAEVARYQEAYADPRKLHAGLELYRAFPANGEFNAARTERLDVPLVWASGARGPFATIGPAVVEALRAKGATNVTSESVPDSDHFVANLQPDFVAGMIERHAG